MKFAKGVFWAAGIWGVLIITPLYFIFDAIGRKNPPPITHPGFYYGFVGAALAWQLAFFVIARDPVRHRPLMIPSVVEKFSYSIAMSVLVAQARTHSADLVFAGVDGLLGILFVIAYLKTPSKPTVGSGTIQHS
jgi:vacuolar-type H+-ATPase subunit I/STV1